MALERKGTFTRQEIYDMIRELRRKQPNAVPPSEPRHNIPPMTKAEQIGLKHFVEVLNAAAAPLS